jgi:nucleoside-diphosphate-sugar epimerase
MKLLITGGAGYIGSKLVPYLAGLGHTITVIDRFDFGNNLEGVTGVDVVELDIFNATVDTFVGYDAVIHLAGLSNDPMANFKPSDNFLENLGGTALIGYLARLAGVKKFIFASSCSVYGSNGRTVSDEMITPQVDFPYGISKIQSEHGLNYLNSNIFRVINLRQATVFGWAPRMRTDLVVNTMTKTSILEGAIYMNDPKACRPLIHIDDLIQVYAKVLEMDNPPAVLNVSAKNYSIGDLAKEIKATLVRQIPELKLVDKKLSDPRSYFVDNRLMTGLIGEWDYVTIPQAVDELITKMPITDIEGWKNPNYINVEMYKQRISKGQ